MKKKKPVQKKFLGGAMLGAMAKDGAIPLMGILPMAYNMAQKKKKKASRNPDEDIAQAVHQRNLKMMQDAASRMEPRKMRLGGKTKKTADGCAVRGNTRLAMKGSGKVG